MKIHVLGTLLLAAAFPATAAAQDARKPYKVEWVYHVRYGFEDEWWRLFAKYQIAALDEERRRGFVTDYVVVRPGLHTSEDSRWDYRVEITYRDREADGHEGEVLKALFPDEAARKHAEARRWELTVNHWDLPIHTVDPHSGE